MKLPYIKIKQRSEVFYLTKFKATELIPRLNFHYREPYSDLETDSVVLKNEKYIELINKKGIELKSSDEGVQRRLQVERINNIKKFIESDSSNYLPNTVLLSADISGIENADEDFIKYENSEFGEFDFPDEFLFSIIDGQHRLAGLSIVDQEILNEIEIPAVILLNVSKPTAAKLFADINGKQRAVNRSLIYDLYANIDKPDFEEIKLFHTICENLYKSEKSPLYRQIKMLGIGSGAISQSFFIDYAKDAVKKSLVNSKDKQTIFNHLFYYFKAFQNVFPEDWPVPINFSNSQELDSHSQFVLKQRKSQLVKTNGFGAILRAFPTVNKLANNDEKDYLRIVQRLNGKIQWIPTGTTGTGKAFQDSLFREIIEIIEK
jgi:DGQHR domain-containing protein